MPSAIEIAKGSTMEVAQRLCKDASYIQEEMLGWRPMDHGKSAVQILSECARVNFAIANAIKGVEPGAPAEEQMDFDSLKGCVIASAEAVCSAIDTLSESTMGDDMVQMPWGTTYSALEASLLPASHMSYHDGQINYIQVLLGDTKFHWAEE